MAAVPFARIRRAGARRLTGLGPIGPGIGCPGPRRAQRWVVGVAGPSSENPLPASRDSRLRPGAVDDASVPLADGGCSSLCCEQSGSAEQITTVAGWARVSALGYSELMRKPIRPWSPTEASRTLSSRASATRDVRKTRAPSWWPSSGRSAVEILTCSGPPTSPAMRTPLTSGNSGRSTRLRIAVDALSERTSLAFPLVDGRVPSLPTPRRAKRGTDEGCARPFGSVAP
jgi:hypothetical protein